ncbi:DNA-J related domain-containing protein [Halopseudomonas laoshanensis]|uniref:DNA-J related domain-containing protein n=1 Tax=Halopseudomonas laoshanensis TaxID=2268758 RepID=UPI003734F88F
MADITPDALLPAGFEAELLTLLAARPGGIDEFALIRELAAMFPGSLFAAPDVLREPLSLFQAHFLLFHVLHRLSDRLANERLEIEVHALRIRLLPRRGGSDGIVTPDPLRAYYLDWDQWLTTQGDDVEKLLQGFRQGPFSVPQDELAQAHGVFELPAPSSAQQVKQRYRSLVQQHHPDKGGDTANIQAVNQAFLILQRYYGKA